MAMLGDLLAEARISAGAFPRLIGASDPDLAAEVERAAAAAGIGVAGYVRAAVVDFTEHAEEADWATLTSRLNGSADPGLACLTVMVRWRLAAPTCAVHASSPAEQTGTELAGPERRETHDGRA